MKFKFLALTLAVLAVMICILPTADAGRRAEMRRARRAAAACGMEVRGYSSCGASGGYSACASSAGYSACGPTMQYFVPAPQQYYVPRTPPSASPQFSMPTTERNPEPMAVVPEPPQDGVGMASVPSEFGPPEFFRAP